MKKFFLTALLMSVLCGVSYGTDIPVFPIGSVFKFPFNPTWGISGPNGFNNNFFFTPIALNESVCVYVYNNNTANAHTFIATILVNGNPSNVTPSDNTWQIAASTGTGLLTASTSPGIPGGIGAQISGASLVSINFSGSSTQAGSPETATIVINQTPGNCFGGNNFQNSAPATVTALTGLQSISDGMTQGFSASSLSTNPANNAPLLTINANSNRNIYFDRVIISCSATCSLSITSVTNAGTCSATTVINNKLGAVNNTAAAANGTCGPNPTIGFGIIAFDLAANTPTTFDLRGIIAPGNTTMGMSIFTNAALTGLAKATFFWYEK